MDLDKEDIINRVARRLPNKAHRQNMTVAELKGFFEMVYDEALIIHNIDTRDLLTKFCVFIDLERNAHKEDVEFDINTFVKNTPK